MKTLMAIGGAINRKNPAVLQEFVRRAGGDAAHIVILPQASALAETGAQYITDFQNLGTGSAAILEFQRRSETVTADHLRLLREATGIFITGGNQMRLSALFGGTSLEAEFHAAYERGCIIAGTSAGAAILSKTMIAYGKSGPTPRERIVQLVPGFGFTDKFIFDMHFRQRDRLGRLIYAITTYPGILGLGVDEDTAAIVEDEIAISVCGSGGVTIVDGSQISSSDVAEIEKGGPVAVSGLNVHVLTNDCCYNRETRAALIPEKKLPTD
jgi:cyanophycinase